MIRHIVMWKFREGTEEKANEFLTKLAALDGVIPQLKKSEVEPNLALIRETLELPEDVKLIPFSAEKGQGREVLLAEITALL